MRGAPIEAMQELMGHSTILMTMRYARLAPEVASAPSRSAPSRMSTGAGAT